MWGNGESKRVPGKPRVKWGKVLGRVPLTRATGEVTLTTATGEAAMGRSPLTMSTLQWGGHPKQGQLGRPPRPRVTGEVSPNNICIISLSILFFFGSTRHFSSPYIISFSLNNCRTQTPIIDHALFPNISRAAQHEQPFVSQQLHLQSVLSSPRSA